MSISASHIQLFRQYFQGREDVFATHWEKDGKSGYMPAYFFDPYMYRTHKMKGGTFQNYQGKTFQSLTNEHINKHLDGEQLIGVYPLLRDNTSWFIAADFDDDNWEKECSEMHAFLNAKNIPAYLERSRSGNGGHLWIFFEQAYPAIKSRKILLELLKQRGVISVFDKSSSFDRLFPNQDFLSGKGLGNLIALPLHGKSMQAGNSCFINPKTFEPYADQWMFLKQIKRISTAALDNLYHEFVKNDSIEASDISGKLKISLETNLKLSRQGLAMPLVNFLKEELNFINTEFIIKKKAGRNTWNTKRYFKFINETATHISVPKGVTGRIIRFCKDNSIEYSFDDNRTKHRQIHYSFNASLREFQQQAVQAAIKKDIGVIVAPPGAGKTVIALKIIAKKQQPALIIVHRKQLADQWMERIQAFLGIPKSEIGKIGNGKEKTGEKITIATIQSLAKRLKKEDNSFEKVFGTIIVDECHHVPAEIFRDAIGRLNAYYLYGLTATPFRKYSDGKLIFAHLGEIICDIKTEDLNTYNSPKIIIRNTLLDVPFDTKTDRFETLSKILVHDTTRNKFILEDVSAELNKNNKAVIVTERKEHIEVLYQYLKQSYEAIALSGEDAETTRQSKWKILKEGNFQVLITTGQYFGEGSDLNNINCLFLVYPFSFEGKLVQYIGRVQRSEIAPVIYDYRDYKIDYLNKLFLKRNTYYRKIEQIPTLFDETIEVPDKKIIRVDRKIKLPIENLEFKYGEIAFKYKIPEINKDLEFDIENLEIRPEFDVLKPYFSKFLKSKNIQVHLFAEFENDRIVSQLAESDDIKRLNKEIIEGMKFRFTETVINSKKSSKESLFDIKSIQSEAEDEKGLYNSGEELLEAALNSKKTKHYQQLRYLAQKHEGTIMKLRFIISPFSFLFMLQGKDQFHIVLETLDTEEATYLWHFDKDKTILRNYLQTIDNNLNVIRNKGRQEFLNTTPANFSRILHDYSDERKGFVIWRDMLEERLV